MNTNPVPGPPERQRQAGRAVDLSLLDDGTREAGADAGSGDTTRSRRISAALAFIGRSVRQRPQTEAEILDKLAARGFEPEVRSAAVALAKAACWIDDEAFAKAWVADRGDARGYAAPRLRMELQRRHVPGPVIDVALDEIESQRDPYDTATRLARQRAGRLPAGLEPEAVARRLIGFLVRRGYAPSLARTVAVSVSGLDREWD